MKHKKLIHILIILISIVSFSLLLTFVIFPLAGNRAMIGNASEEIRNGQPPPPASETSSPEPEPTQAPIAEDTPSPTITDPAGIEGLEALKTEVGGMLSEYDGDWAVYVKNLDTNEYFQINSHQMISASLIKLYIMAGYYQAVADGAAEMDDMASEYMKYMITVSHNEASNELVKLLGGGDHATGMTVVNQYASDNGYDDTRQERDMKDIRTEPVAGENYTSVYDCGLLLESIYSGECVNPEASAEMLDLLKGQTRTWKIPAGVPEGIETANKTGELSTVENDVAIVFSPACDYIICVMSNDLSVPAIAQKNIVEISEAVYGYFNP